jgi:hypothetical protein
MIEDSEREEIEKLLPWYVTGRLGLADARKVERYLRQHPDAQRQLQWIDAERQETTRANEAMEWPHSDMSERLLAALPQGTAPTARRGRLSSFGQFFRLPPSLGMQWAALALALVVLAQAAFIVTLLTHERTYRLATGCKEATGSKEDGVPALVAFADDAKAADVTRFLTDFAASIVDGPKPGGVYKIKLRSLDTSQPAGDALLSKLAERRDVVRIVLPSRD